MRLDPVDVRRLRVPSALLVLIGVAGFSAPGTWKFVAVTAVVQGMVALSAGMLFGRAGLLLLCPLTFAGIGAWAVAWVTVHGNQPFFLKVAIGGLAAIPFGVLVGGLASRLRGVNLAVVTLTFAAAVVTVFSQHKFPGSQDSVNRSTRPAGFESDRMYFVLCLTLLVIIGLILEWYGRRRSGLAWRAVRSSERATAGAGLNVPMVKIQACVVSAAISGIAGALLVGQNKGSVSEVSFIPIASLAVVAAAVLVGAQSLSGAVFAGALAAVVPEMFHRFGWSTEYAQILFGIGAVQALSQGGGGISATFPWRKPRRSTEPPPAAPDPVAPANRRASDDRPILELRDLRVRYGSLVALNDVSISVPPLSVVSVIGPNGAGKSTLVDAVCGFVDDYAGTVTLEGRDIGGLTAAARARAGLRRTFQQGRAIPELTVGQYINLGVPRPIRDAAMAELLGFFGLPPADQPISFVDVGTRRVVEVAASLASRPKVAFLDEPAAGLGREQSQALGRRIVEIPARFGCSVVLIEHNVELVADVSSEITVLDFGVVIAHGTPEEVLSDPKVAAAYLGDDVGIEVPSVEDRV